MDGQTMKGLALVMFILAVIVLTVAYFVIVDQMVIGFMAGVVVSTVVVWMGISRRGDR